MGPGEDRRRAAQPGEQGHDEAEAWLDRLPGPRWAWTHLPLALLVLGALALASTTEAGITWPLVGLLVVLLIRIYARRWWSPRARTLGQRFASRRDGPRASGDRP